MKIMPSVLLSHPRAFYRIEVKVIVTVVTLQKIAAIDYILKACFFHLLGYHKQ